MPATEAEPAAPPPPRVSEARDTVVALVNHLVWRLPADEALLLYDLLAQQFGDTADELEALRRYDLGGEG